MNEIENKPVPVSDWILSLLLLSIPFVNLVMLIVWAAGATTHPSKKTFALASLIWMGIGVVLALGVVILVIATGGMAAASRSSY